MQAAIGTRAVRLRGVVSPWAVYDRAMFGAGAGVAGPAIIEEHNATSVILPDWRGTVDDWGNLRLTRN
jgi:N-methylhydantoinase A